MEIPSFDYEEIMKSQQDHDKIGENETKIEENKIQQPIKYNSIRRFLNINKNINIRKNNMNKNI